MKKRINNVNIKQCFDPPLNKKVVDENFYECIHKNSNNPKILGTMPNKPSKEVEEELTNITNNLLILLQLLKINNYFENKEHKYLLKSDMKLEIIRNIKNEDNIIDVFNILKDILQLDKDKDKDYEYEYY